MKRVRPADLRAACVGCMLAVLRALRNFFSKGALMIFGMTILTFVHVLLSLLGILAGFVVTFGLLTSRPSKGWTALFIWTTVATSASGFLFPFHRFLPSHAVGILSLLVLTIAIYAL